MRILAVMEDHPATPGQPPSPDVKDGLRGLPRVDAVLGADWAVALSTQHGRDAVKAGIQQALEGFRADIRAGGRAGNVEVATREALAARAQRSLRRVINATGVVLHTNLGRAPLAEEALQAALDVGRGYSNLEMDLGTGRRGSRYAHCRSLLLELLGCEDALVVNNGAAAVLLALSAVAAGREAVVSRGELVEIGGGFRIPDVITQGGARLREVGTTNRTRAADYRAACGPDTAVLLKVHQSNFSVVGFTEAASVAELARVAAETRVPLMVDLGTGRTSEPLPFAAEEPSARGALQEGADLVMFSGDKLLGGPQAGIVAGRADLVARCRAHPLCRALRVDKLSLAALEATLALHRNGQTARIPALALLHTPVAALRARAGQMARGLAGLGITVDVADTLARPGGGTLPTVTVPSVALRVAHADVDGLGAQLRRFDPPVVTRVAEGALWVDLRTVFPDEDAAVQRALAWALGRVAQPAADRGTRPRAERAEAADVAAVDAEGPESEGAQTEGADGAGADGEDGMNRRVDPVSTEDGPC